MRGEPARGKTAYSGKRTAADQFADGMAHAGEAFFIFRHDIPFGQDGVVVQIKRDGVRFAWRSFGHGSLKLR